MVRALRLISVSGLALAAAVGCSTFKSKSNARVPASQSTALKDTAFGAQLASLKMDAYFANLHAHHFMGAKGSKKNPMSLEEAIKPGPCRAEHATFPMDDGRPCRDENGEENVTIAPRGMIDDGSPDLSDYFRQACEYATTKGELDILFITPHTKNNGQDEGQIVTSTNEGAMMLRQRMLASMNPDRLGSPKFVCGLGQEASSISAGNHINIFGQFHSTEAASKDDAPFFFKTGDFRALYPAIKAKNDAGGKVFLQLNHPDVARDLYWGDLATFGENKRRKKESLNDYGLDDFGPVGCLTGKLPAETPECAGVSGTHITPELLKKTFANIRRVSGDPFRLIEVISPGAAKEGGEDTDGDGKTDTAGEDSFGATNNSRETFRAVQHRTTRDTYEDGVYDWVFYLSMGLKLGPTANQDNHHMNWGSATASRTGVLTSSLKEGAVLKALSSRHVFASEDKNAKVLLSQTTGDVRKIMGDVAHVRTPETKIQISYYDPDGEEASAKVRLYYYRSSDSLFGKGLSSQSAFHTVSFDSKGGITLPAPDAAGRSANDLISIRSGEVLSLDLPLTAGAQWVFAEIIQDKDFDKIWTAPIWINRAKPKP